MLSVILKSLGNPDFGEDPDEAVYGVPEMTVQVANFDEASRACRNYLAEHDLGAGNWAGGQVLEDGVLVATVSYNGRVWGPGGSEIVTRC